MKKIFIMSMLSVLPVCAEKIPVYLGSGSEEGISYALLDTESGELSEGQEICICGGSERRREVGICGIICASAR
jgi:hypothetical protein